MESARGRPRRRPRRTSEHMGPNEDNHANQMNPEHDAYWESRGYDERPDDYQERADE